MVLASASIPLLFPPVEIGTHLLWDGGLLVNTPLAPVVALGADEIVTVLVTEPRRSRPRAVPALRPRRRAHRRQLPRERLQRRPQAAARAQPPHAPPAGNGGYRDVTLYEAVRPEREACFNRGLVPLLRAGARRDVRAGPPRGDEVARRRPGGRPPGRATHRIQRLRSRQRRDGHGSGPGAALDAEARVDGRTVLVPCLSPGAAARRRARMLRAASASMRSALSPCNPIGSV